MTPNVANILLCDEVGDAAAPHAAAAHAAAAHALAPHAAAHMRGRGGSFADTLLRLL